MATCRSTPRGATYRHVRARQVPGFAIGDHRPFAGGRRRTGHRRHRQRVPGEPRPGPLSRRLPRPRVAPVGVPTAPDAAQAPVGLPGSACRSLRQAAVAVSAGAGSGYPHRIGAAPDGRLPRHPRRLLVPLTSPAPAGFRQAPTGHDSPQPTPNLLTLVPGLPPLPNFSFLQQLRMSRAGTAAPVEPGERIDGGTRIVSPC